MSHLGIVQYDVVVAWVPDSPYFIFHKQLVQPRLFLDFLHFGAFKISGHLDSQYIEANAELLKFLVGQ
jgi:hypothetical protein